MRRSLGLDAYLSSIKDANTYLKSLNGRYHHLRRCRRRSATRPSVCWREDTQMRPNRQGATNETRARRARARRPRTRGGHEARRGLASWWRRARFSGTRSLCEQRAACETCQGCGGTRSQSQELGETGHFSLSFARSHPAWLTERRQIGKLAPWKPRIPWSRLTRPNLSSRRASTGRWRIWQKCDEHLRA